MSRVKNRKKKNINSQLRNLILTVLIPMAVMTVFAVIMFFNFNYRYANAGANITKASQFSQDFKNDIDLKMYYFATDSEYATGIPYSEVETALMLAQELQNDTTNRQSLSAISSVRSLCINLRDRMEQIRVTESYDQRMKQLESNVYIITELIQNYMYTYLYYEAGELAAIQENMNFWLYMEIIFLIAVSAVVIVVTVIKSIRISRSITKPIDGLYERVRSIGEGDLSVREPVEADDVRIRVLSEGFEEMTGRLNHQMELNREEADRLRSMELMLLQAQINPHFLYNTLDTIIWLVETEKNKQAVEMVSSLSNFFRSSLSKGRDVITLEEEEVHVRSYLEIQQVRYKDILTYSIDIDPAIRSFAIPKLTLQPIVENALYHGIKLKRGMGSIAVTGRLIDEKICLEVKDTGIGMNAGVLAETRNSLTAEHPSGFGMSAVYKRLKLMFADECSFKIESSEGIGTTVTIVIHIANKDKVSEEG